MKTALVIGATGLVGKALVKELMEAGEINFIYLAVRKLGYFNNNNVQEIETDFDKPIKIDAKVDAIFCCLGTTIKKAGSKPAFEKVDYEYPLKYAQWGLTANAKAFYIVTAMGASIDSSFFYNKVKGKVENAISQLNYHTFGVFRPSMLLGERTENRMGEKVGKVVMKAFDFAIPSKYKAIEAQTVAKAMLNFSRSNKEGTHVIENDEMLAMV